jgi:hypothetical protein
VYICDLPYGTDENMLAEHFGTIGLLKVWSLTWCCIELHLVPVLPSMI